jgi:SprT protein
MPAEKPFAELAKFLPSNTYEHVVHYFETHTIHLNLVKERKSVLGDYRAPSPDNPFHRISININLSPFSFLITLLHELAHLDVYVRHQHSVKAHGNEWKSAFRNKLQPFIGKNFFPTSIENALLNYLQNPKASTCTDPNLYKALYAYGQQKEGWTLIDQLAIGTTFEIEGGKRYKIIERRRSRYKCQEIKTGKLYLFPSVYEVRPC